MEETNDWKVFWTLWSFPCDTAAGVSALYCRYLTRILSAGSAFFVTPNGSMTLKRLRSKGWDSAAWSTHCTLVWSLHSSAGWMDEDATLWSYCLILSCSGITLWWNNSHINVSYIALSKSHRVNWSHWSDTLHQYCIHFDTAGDQHEILYTTSISAAL